MYSLRITQARLLTATDLAKYLSSAELSLATSRLTGAGPKICAAKNRVPKTFTGITIHGGPASAVKVTL
jgi:hypothetical protein